MNLDSAAVIWNRPEHERDNTPLLIAMHGRGSNERDLAGLAPALPAAFTIASLRALYDEGPGWSWYTAGGVNLPGDPATESADTAADAVLAWLDALPFTPTSVGTLGFSQGGVMAVHLLRRAPERIAFAVNLAGFVVSGGQPADAALASQRPPVFWGRGDADLVIGPAAVARSDPWLQEHTALTARVYPGVGHTISQEELDDVVGFLEARVG